MFQRDAMAAALEEPSGVKLETAVNAGERLGE